MSGGCEGCFTSTKGQQEALNKTLKEAKDYAVKEQTPVAVYQEGFEFFYCRADVAIERGYNVRQFVSQYQ